MWKKLTKHIKIELLIFFFIILVIFLINAFHEEYSDEYDSMLGGKLILQGQLPYRDWFQHHQPGTYVLSALILIFSKASFVRYRFCLGIVFFLINVGGLWVIKKRLKEKNFNWNFYLIFLAAIAVAGTYFWWQMNIADTLATYFLIPAYTLLILKTICQEPLEKKDVILISTTLFLVWFTSMTYSYLVLGLMLIVSALIFYQKEYKKLFQTIIIFTLPYLIFFFFLLGTSSLKDYFFSTVTYNQNYYIYNAGNGPGTSINPLRYSVTIAMNFLNNFWPALTMIKGFNLSSPLVVCLAITNVGFIYYLVSRKKIAALLVFLIVTIYGSARANPLNVKQTDYQSSVYIMSSFVLGFLLFQLLKKSLDENSEKTSRRIIDAFLLITLAVYWFFNLGEISLVFCQKIYAKYMGQAPLIYNNPQVAPYVDAIIGEKPDYAWIGPFEFKELFYLKKAKMPSKYHWFLQHAAKSKIKDEILADFKKKRAKLIVFNRTYTPWGGSPEEFNYFFTDFLDRNYFRIFELNRNLKKYQYVWKIGNTRNFNIDGDFYFDKNRQQEIIDQLLSLRYIEKISNGQ